MGVQDGGSNGVIEHRVSEEGAVWGDAKQTYTKLRVLTTSWTSHFDFQKMQKGWGGQKAHTKLRVPTNSWTSHFDFQKMKAGGGWKSTHKAHDAHQLLDFPLPFRKPGWGGCEKAHTKLRMPHDLLHFPLRFAKNGGEVKKHTQSWGCPPPPGLLTSICKKWEGGGVEKTQTKMNVPTTSRTSHLDFQKMGAGVKTHTQSWGCPAPA